MLPPSDTLHDPFGALANRWAQDPELEAQALGTRNRLTSLRTGFSRVVAGLARDVKK
jgi:hypothetical protein